MQGPGEPGQRAITFCFIHIDQDEAANAEASGTPAGVQPLRCALV